MEINILIDSMTNCLEDKQTGKLYDTTFRKRVTPFSKKEIAEMKRKGWKFDWSIPWQEDYEIYELLLERDDVIQGMIAIKHIPEQYYTHITLVESAPFNIGYNGKYKGVGAHLFAIACKLSWDAGNEGYVQFTAKTMLIDHYKRELNAREIDANNLYIDSYGALALINKYFKEG